MRRNKALPLSGATILQVIPHLSAGGAERTTIEIAEALTAAGARRCVASVGGRLEGELTRAGAELIDSIDSLASKNPLTIYAQRDALSKIITTREVNLDSRPLARAGLERAVGGAPDEAAVRDHLSRRLQRKERAQALV